MPFREVLLDLRYDPGLIQTWRDKEPSRYAAFKECSEHVARGVIFIFRRTKAEREEMERRLSLDALDPEALVVRRHPQDEEECRGRSRTGQKIDTMHTRRLMVEQLEQVEHSTGYTGREAMEILSERKAREGKDWSVSKIRQGAGSGQSGASGGGGVSAYLKGYAGQDARLGEIVDFRHRDTGASLLAAPVAQAVSRGDLLVMKNGKAHVDQREGEVA